MRSASRLISAGLTRCSSCPTRSRNGRTSSWIPSINSSPNSFLQPVFDLQLRNLAKVAQVRRQEEYIVDKGDTGDLQIHTANAHFRFPQALEFLGGALFEVEQMERAQEIQQLSQALVSGNLFLRHPLTVDLSQPAAQLLFNIYDGRG